MTIASRARRAWWLAMACLGPGAAGGQEMPALRDARAVGRLDRTEIDQAGADGRIIIRQKIRIGRSDRSVIYELVPDVRTSPAQGDGFDEVPQPVTKPAANAPRPAVDRRAIDMTRARLASENFDELIFGESTRSHARWADLESTLRSRIDGATRVFKLDEAARAKLLLAGRGDMQRTLDRIEAARREFEASRSDPKAAIGILERSATLSEGVRKPFGPDSLYEKTLNTIAVAPLLEKIAR